MVHSENLLEAKERSWYILLNILENRLGKEIWGLQLWIKVIKVSPWTQSGNCWE